MKRKYLILGGLALAAISSYGAKKGIDTIAIIKRLQTTLKAIKGLSFTNAGIEARIDLQITNPTDQPLNVNGGGALIVRQINIYDRANVLVATAKPNLAAINIVPGGTVVLEDVKVATQFGTILNSILGNPSTNPDDYRVETVLETMTGNMIVI